MLRSAKANREILRLHIKPDANYEILVENEPLTEEHEGNAKSSDHFRYYYQLIAKPKVKWYEFKLADYADLTPSESVRFIYTNYIEPPPCWYVENPVHGGWCWKEETVVE